MKKTSFALILLASAAAFSGVARADETTTAGNQESARVARDGGVFTGAPALESRQLRVQHQPAASAVAQGDHFLFQIGDRGIGNN